MSSGTHAPHPKKRQFVRDGEVPVAIVRGHDNNAASISWSPPGRRYRLSAVYEQDGTLRARIFRGIPLFGKTEVLKRVDLHSLAGMC